MFKPSGHITRAQWAQIRKRVNHLVSLGVHASEIIESLDGQVKVMQFLRRGKDV